MTKIFKPTSEEKLADWMRVVEDVGGFHLMVVDWVRSNMGFTDEQAIHAAAYSIKASAMDKLRDPDLVFYEPAGESEKDLENLELYAAYQGVRKAVAFVELTGALYGMSEAEVVNAMTAVVDKKEFHNCKDYAALADMVNMQHRRDLGEIEDEKFFEVGEDLMARVMGVES